jgi:hypothetical protein
VCVLGRGRILFQQFRSQCGLHQHLPLSHVDPSVDVLPLSASVDFSILELASVHTAVAHLVSGGGDQSIAQVMMMMMMMILMMMMMRSDVNRHVHLSAFPMSPSVDELPLVHGISKERVAKRPSAQLGSLASESLPLPVEADGKAHIVPRFSCAHSDPRPL